MPRRKLNEEERAIVWKIAERGNGSQLIAEAQDIENLAVEFRKRGRITAAVIYSMDSEDVAIGIATFNPLDVVNGLPYSDALGERIALAKAAHRARCL